jgi:hypothetical protein
MNEYLAKLHKLESLACSQSGKKGLLGEPSKPSKPSFEGFEGDQGKRFSETEPITSDIEIGVAMQFNMAAAKNKTPPDYPQNPQNVCAPYARVMAALSESCPAMVEVHRWEDAKIDAEAFLQRWGEQAEALGWTARDLLGLHTIPERPAPGYRRLSRYDETGLIWLLRGRPVVALAGSTAAIESPTGAITIYRKNNNPALGPVGDSLDDIDPSGWRP